MTKQEAEQKWNGINALAKEMRDKGLISMANELVERTRKEIEKDCPVATNRPLEIGPSLKILESFLTCNPEMLELKANVKKVINEEDSVLIMGESGTGKEILAKSLHGNRGDNNFISVNCAALPMELAESELFGHRRGAFTGADTETDGFFGAAKDGTIFLDEIGDLKPDLQSKLLRVLNDGVVRKVGATYGTKVKVRVVCATHHSLPHLVDEGKFRLDLYGRLSTIEFITIPLRERREDIKLIVDSLDKTKKGVYELLKEKQWTVQRKKEEIKGPFWDTHNFLLNVRDLQKIVRRVELFGKI